MSLMMSSEPPTPNMFSFVSNLRELGVFLPEGKPVFSGLVLPSSWRSSGQGLQPCGKVYGAKHPGPHPRSLFLPFCCLSLKLNEEALFHWRLEVLFTICLSELSDEHSVMRFGPDKILVNTVSSHLEKLPFELFLLPAETTPERPLCLFTA